MPRRPFDRHKHEAMFDDLPPQLLSSVTVKDYVNVLKTSRWNNDYRNEVYKAFFNVKSMDDIVYSDYKCSMAMALVLRYVLPDFFKEKGLNVDKISLVDTDGDYAASYNAIEVAPGKFESRLNYGDYLISKDSQKYIVHLEEAYPDSFLFKIAGIQNSTPDVHKLSEEMVKYGEEHNFLKGQKIDPHCSFIKFDRKFEWKDLILPDKIKEKIRQNITNLIDSRSIYKKNGLSIKRGIVLAGNPGTGKTQLFKVLCNQIDWTVVWITPKHLESAKRVSQIITLCKDLAPTIMLLEDLDLYAGDRSSNHNPAVLGELMNQLDGVQDNTDIITIATTNNKEVLEKALLDRPGRFDLTIDFPLPEVAERLQMLKVFSNGLVDEKLPFLEEIANEYSKEMTGAQVKELVHMAIIFAIDEQAYDADKKLLLKEKHFKKAVSTIKKKDFSKALGFNSPGSSSPLGSRFDELLDSCEE